LAATIDSYRRLFLELANGCIDGRQAAGAAS